MPPRKVIAIVGPTASGKTALAIELASQFGGEIIGADSRQVYRYMDIGTAKPTPEERDAAPHHLVDIIDPDEHFSLGLWLDLAGAAIEGIQSRGRVPIIAGGTGQYVWALLEGWRVPRVEPDQALRAELSDSEPAELVAELEAVDPEAGAYIDPRNVRRVVRALEVYRATGKPLSFWRTKEPPEFEALILAPAVERAALYERIDARVDSMFESGFVEEVQGLLDRGYNRELPAMSSIGYREVCQHLSGEMDLPETIERTKYGTHGFARHQNSWFKRTDDRIKWVGGSNEAATTAGQFLDVGSSV